MRTYSSGGFALAALLCLAPRSSALTIVQSFNEDVVAGGLSPTSSSGHIGVVWNAAAFNAALGTLQAVEFAGAMAAHLFTHESNPDSNSVLVWTPQIYFNSRIGLPDFGTLANHDDSAFGSSVSLPYLAQGSFNADFLHGLNGTVSSPNQLQQFVGASPIPINLIQDYGSNISFGGEGGVGGSGTVDLTMTYVYSTPDFGNTWPLLVFSCVLLAALRKRFLRR